MICSACQQRIDVPGYGVARPLDADGGPHVCPPLEVLLEPPQAKSEAVEPPTYVQLPDGRWKRSQQSGSKGVDLGTAAPA